MKIIPSKEFTGGWIIGSFEPSLFHSKDFEIGIKHYKKNDIHDTHTHKQITEYNYLVSGKMKMQDQVIEANSVFIVYPWEISNPEFLEDCTIVVIKTPSIPDDKTTIIL